MPDPIVLIPSTKIYLWVSVATSNGNFSVGDFSEGDLSGVAAAHAVCQREGNGERSVLPNTDSVEYTHQAVIGSKDPVTLNITFHPSTIIATGDTRGVYRPDDSTKIANSYANFISDPDVLAAVASGSAKRYWTGLGDMGNIGDTCLSWSSSSSSNNGIRGRSNKLAFNRIGGSTNKSSCNNSTFHLLCVSH